MTHHSDLIRVMTVDDMEIAHAGFAKQLDDQEDIRVVGRVNNPTTLMDEVRLMRPHVILLDVRMGEYDVLGFLEALRDERQGPYPRVLIVSAVVVPYIVQHATELEISGYLFKEDAWLSRLPDFIRDAHAGRSVDSTSVAAMRRQLRDKRPPRLTEREKAVLRLLMNEDLDAAQIANRLGKSRRAIYSTIERIRTKVGVGSTVELKELMREMGLYYRI